MTAHFVSGQDTHRHIYTYTTKCFGHSQQFLGVMASMGVCGVVVVVGNQAQPTVCLWPHLTRQISQAALGDDTVILRDINTSSLT